MTDWYPTGVTVERFGPGQAPDPTTLRTGDLLLCHNPAKWWTKTGFVSAAIRFGQWRRYRHDKWAAWPNHVAVVDSDRDGMLLPELRNGPCLIEAAGRGVVVSSLSDYQPVDYILVRAAAFGDERFNVRVFIESKIGDKYGYLTIVCEALICLFNSPVWFGIGNSEICSGLAARALERAGWLWKRQPSTVMPADVYYVAAGGRNPWPK